MELRCIKLEQLALNKSTIKMEKRGSFRKELMTFVDPSDSFHHGHCEAPYVRPLQGLKGGFVLAVWLCEGERHLGSAWKKYKKSKSQTR